ncbi:hypothetical protein CHU98_g11423 [Xylaria longipes]|nr:hypothetical protein CHU98_g11423 [Xylaria longipes]
MPHSKDIRPENNSSDSNLNSSSREPPRAGYGTASVSTPGTGSLGSKERQNEDLIAVGSQFWGNGDNDYGHPTELSIDEAGATSKSNQRSCTFATLAIRVLSKTSLICFIDALHEYKETQVWGVLEFLERTCKQAASSGTILRPRSTGEIPNGQCWSYLFANPVIAQGFPILQRAEPDSGLEIPLELMTALTATRYLNTFNSNVFIKGFNTMLVPVKQSGDLLVWHLLYSQNPSERISYLSPDLECTDIKMTDLSKFRHILGWCADATSIVGTTRATYDIERSHLPRAHSHHMLEKVEISAGQFVTGTAAFTLGNREKPVHISRFGFLTKLQWISSKHMVLWDEGGKRGWLVNGASVLLHILRASLAHSKRKFGSEWLLDPSALSDCEDLSRPDACLQVLINKNNRNLTLYMDKSEIYEESKIDGTTTNNTSRTQTRH